ncbi:MAG TPA: beta-glucosidase BglX [Chitinophagaceae bacterium]|nr:beta-glucosidase BglX [Chitinophagaceae bacterium]
MLRKIVTLSALLVSLQLFSQNNDAKMNAFITNLMKQMTLEEKIGQLNLPSVGFDVTGPILSQGVEEKIKKGLVGGVFNTYTPVAVRKLQELAVTQTRLKIPLLFGYDVIHGHRTIFPIPLGLSASWDLNLIERTARAAAEEASADGLNWTFSPMVDIARDPRWGRVSEGAGEDHWLGSQIAKAMVRGYQGTDLSRNNTILACVKHFALYGAAEGGRDYNTVDMSRLRMYNEYLPPYKAAVDAGAATVMTSFNEVEGIPATGNKWLMNDLLRKQWGFKGLIVTDYTAVNEMIAHGVGNGRKVAELALNAGVDMDMVGELFIQNGAALVQSKQVSVARIDAACRHILEAKYKLGLFDDPYRYVNEERSRTEIMNAQKLALSKEAAIKSSVLLKNDNQTLPLNQSRKIAFIGPMVKIKRDLIGNWSAAGDGNKAISVWEALETKYGAGKFLYAKGSNLVDDKDLIAQLNPHGAQLTPDAKTPAELIAEAVQVAQQSDVVVAVVGEPFGMSGEAASRSDIGLLENQKELLKALNATGKPIVLVLMNGRPLTLSWEDREMDAILETWYPGTNGGPAIVDLLFGDANPSGKLSMSFPRNVGQIPIYYNHKMTGRPRDPNQKYTSKYLDVANDPLYPFGFGLSYTTFSYGDVTVSKPQISSTESLEVRCTVTNTGNYDGEETVQLYLRDVVGSITRPVKELKAFQKIVLRKGESKEVVFRVTGEDLKFYNSELKWVSEPGEFHVFVGPNSRDVKQARFTLR